MELSQKDLVKIAEDYVHFFRGVNLKEVIRIQADRAELNLKYFDWSGSDIAVVHRIITVANGGGKLKNLFESFAKDDFYPTINLGSNLNPILSLDVKGYIPFIPTSLSYFVSTFELISGWIHNHTDSAIRALIHIKINSNPIKVRVDLPPNQLTRIPEFPIPLIDFSSINFTNKTASPSKLTLELFIAGNNAPCDVIELGVWITAPNIFVIAADIDGKVFDFSDALAWLVDSNNEKLEELAHFIIKNTSRRKWGYHKNSPTEIDAQVKDLYDALSKKSIDYISSELLWLSEGNKIIQRIRTPQEILQSDELIFNCLDGSILFASILERFSISSLLIIVPGHVIVGWKRYEDVPPIINDEFWQKIGLVDITGIGKLISFEVAQSFAQGITSQFSHYFKNKSAHDLNSFCKIIDPIEAKKTPSLDIFLKTSSELRE